MQANASVRRDFKLAQLDLRTQNTLFVCVLLFAGIVLFYFYFLFRLYYGALILILVYLAYVTHASKLRRVYSYAAIVAACYLYLAISISWSPQLSVSFYRISVDLVYFLFVLFPIFEGYCSKDIKFRMLQTASLAACCTACVAFLTLGEFVDPEKGSIRSTYGSIFLASIPAHVYLYSKRKSVLSLALLIAILVLAFNLGNRTLLIFGPPMLLVSVFLVLREEIQHSRNLRYVLGAAILALPIVIYGGSQLDLSKAYYRVTHATSLEVGRQVLKEQMAVDNPEDIERRIYTYVAISTFLARPITGGGYGSSSYYVRRVSNFETPAHGLPFMLLGEAGLIGTILFGTAIYLSFHGYKLKMGREKRDGNNIAVWFELLTFICILLVGASHQVYEDIYFYMFLGTGLLYKYHHRTIGRGNRIGNLGLQVSTNR
jgi:hypothetical protein